MYVIGRIGRICLEDFNAVLEENKEEVLDTVVKNMVRTGYLLSGNHRYAVKELIRVEEPSLYNQSTYWKQTYAQIYVGLSEAQARYLSRISNDREKSTQGVDTTSSIFEVRLKQAASITDNRRTQTFDIHYDCVRRTSERPSIQWRRSIGRKKIQMFSKVF
mgnify:CR=1 FL=1